MTRVINPEMVAAITADTLYPFFAVWLDFVSGPMRLWTGYTDLSWGGNTFSGLGSLGSVSQVEETKRVVANGVELKVTGIPSAMIALAQTEKFKGRRMKLWIGAIDPDTGLVIPDPIVLFAGELSNMETREGEDTTDIVIFCESKMVDLDRSRVRYFTDEDHQLEHPGDKICSLVNQAATASIPWGLPSETKYAPPSDDGNDTSYML